MIGFLLIGCSLETALVEASTLNPMHTMDRGVDRTPVTVGIAEKVNAGSYLYLKTDESPPRWIASLSKPVEAGDEVTFVPIGKAVGFHSGRTGRTFDELWFSVVTPL